MTDKPDLMKERVPEQIEEIDRVLHPLRVRSSVDDYPLKTAAELDQADIAAAIKDAFGLTEVPEVVFCSRPEITFHVNREGEFWEWVEGSITPGTYKMLLDLLERNLGDDLMRKLVHYAGDWPLNLVYGYLSCEYEHEGSEALYINLEDLVICYLGFCLCRDSEMAQKFARLLALQTDCLLLGTKADDANVWVVFCQ